MPDELGTSMHGPTTPCERVLIVTGGYLSGTDDSLLAAAWKQLVQSRHARGSWLEAKVKATIAEPVVMGRIERRWRRRRWSPRLRSLLDARDNFATPELTEVVLATEVAREGLSFELMTFDQLLRGGVGCRAKLRSCSVVFASATFLRDLSELEPLVARLKRPWNRVVVGGALAGTLHEGWEGSPHVDVLAVGYGERLVPVLARWIRSGFRDLHPPVGGRVSHRGNTTVLHAGAPPSRSLDSLARPDWALVERYHGADYRMIHYESVRGCPYRCAFCNYPFLFDDTKFRTKSAERMVDDWACYVRTLGVEYITCLDSLFTMPRARLEAFCRALVRRELRAKWICYARADDLCDPAIVALMIEAGCVQVQIGIESGDQGQLERMNKRTTVEENGRALETCRRLGLTTVVSLVVGFPGETDETLRRTLDFLAASPPDFHFLATFSTRVANVPILQPENAGRHDLVTDANPRTVSPYWRHGTMSCADAARHARAMTHALIERRISLDATMFYSGLLRYNPQLRGEMLDFQRAAMRGAPLVTTAFGRLHSWLDRRVAADVSRALGSRSSRTPLPLAHATS